MRAHSSTWRILGVLILAVILCPATPTASSPAAAFPPQWPGEAVAGAPDFTLPRPVGWGPGIQPTPAPTSTPGPTPGPSLPPEQEPGSTAEGQILQAPPALDRGYYGGSSVEYYDVAVYPTQGNCNIINYGSLVATEIWETPVDFALACPGEGGSSPPWKDCRLHPNLTRGDYYGTIWEGQLLVPEDGQYTFYFEDLDDRARLTVDTTEVIKHWCLGDEGYSGAISLDAGLHDIRVEYFQGIPTEASLEIKWQGPGFSKELIQPVWPLPGDFCNSDDPVCEMNGSCGGIDPWPGGEINAFSGNHVYQVEDLGVPVAGGAFSFERTYASQDITATVLGYGWTHNYAICLVFPDDLGGEDWTTIVNAPDGLLTPMVGLNVRSVSIRIGSTQRCTTHLMGENPMTPSVNKGYTAAGRLQ
jgi:hypothetical protein